MRVAHSPIIKLVSEKLLVRTVRDRRALLDRNWFRDHVLSFVVYPGNKVAILRTA